MSAHRRRSSPNRIHWLIIGFFSVLILGGFYLLAGFGPKPSGSNDGSGGPDPAVTDLLVQSREKEAQFDELVLEGVVDRNDIETLLRAIELQKRYIARLPGRDFSADSRLEDLERKLSDYMGEIQAREAEQLEAEAESLMETDSAAALGRYREALEIRENIRDQYYTSSYNDPAVLSRLNRTVRKLSMMPRYEESIELEEEAERLEERGELTEAVKKYAEAAELQEEINRTSPGLAISRPLRASRLREKEASVLSGQLKRRIDEMLREGNDLVYNEKYDEAAAVFARAREIQRNLNLEYAKSPYASRAREEYLRERQQNAAAFSSYRDLVTTENLLNKALFAGNFDEAKLLISRLSDDLNRFGIRYSQSSLPIEGLVEKVTYLKRKERLLEQIHSAVNRSLLALPGTAGAEMLATEVPQYLYESVMDKNPSRNKGPDLPVETVSGSEVRLFIERMEWILARVVRLPTIEEFRLVAELEMEEEGLTIISVESGDTESREVSTGRPGSNGYHHLLGNVAELVRDGPEGGNLSQIGGNLRMLESDIRELNAVSTSPNERNRMVGFRFVVEDRMLPGSLPEDPDV